jgi:phosphocarrier protein HPr
MERTKRLKIINNLGLHGRAAAKIVELNSRYKSRLFFKRDGYNEVDGSSILSMLTLACPKGTEVEARAVGEDSDNLLEDLSRLFEAKFGEGK